VELRWKYHVHLSDLKLTVLDCIVAISFGALSCTVGVLTCFVMCGCFENCVGVLVTCVLVFTMFLYYLYCVFVLFHLWIFILVWSVCTSVRTTATE
jgi:hypothetical protein